MTMKTIALVATTTSVLAGCIGEDPVTRLEIEQAPAGLTFSFEGKIHDFDVWRCTTGCEEARFADVSVGCGFENGALAWRTAVTEGRDPSRDGPHDEAAPITGPIVYGQKPPKAAFSSEPAAPLVDGYYFADAARWEDTCKDRQEPCWQRAYHACGYFRVEGKTITPIDP